MSQKGIVSESRVATRAAESELNTAGGGWNRALVAAKSAKCSEDKHDTDAESSGTSDQIDATNSASIEGGKGSITHASKSNGFLIVHSCKIAATSSMPTFVINRRSNDAL